MNSLHTIAALALALPLTFACSDDDPEVSSSTIVDVATDAGSFSTLLGALEATGLDETLRGPGPFTVFAPTDDAFARLPDGVVAGLDTQTLASILTYHVVDGAVGSDTVITLDSANTVEGNPVTIQVIDGTVILNGVVQVTTTDIAADNGVIHVIDSVLLPIDFPGDLVDAALAYPIFDPLVGAVTTADLAAALKDDNEGNGLTLFAPINKAFDAIDTSGLSNEDLGTVLSYHVVAGTVDAATVVGLDSATTIMGADISIEVAGGGVILNDDTNVIQTDIRTTNGILHVIDGVLLPPSN